MLCLLLSHSSPFPKHDGWLESCRRYRGCRWEGREQRQCRGAPCRCRIESWCWVTSGGSCHSPPPRTCWAQSCVWVPGEGGSLPHLPTLPRAHWPSVRACRKVSLLSTSDSAPGLIWVSLEVWGPGVGPPPPSLPPLPPSPCSEGTSTRSTAAPYHHSARFLSANLRFFIPNVWRRQDGFDWWFWN